ncbi:MAG: type IX secretion system membrane protein PorP/SprF [Bacteroidota bacterium]|nr:type IX secretion system membrane protein PorP/SprF [Bacteroidota bacterium]
MKRLLIFIFVLFSGNIIFGQQLSLRSQYLNDDFLLNPAIAGTKDYNPLTTTFRRQWAGIEGAPVTQSVSYHAYAGKNLGLGGYLFNDVCGPTRRTGFNFSLAYQIKLSKNNDSKLSFGLSALLFQNVFDATKLTTDEPNDVAINNLHQSMLAPDANFGIYYYSGSKYFIGVSAHHLIQSKVDLFNTMNDIPNTVNRTYYLSGGYGFNLSENLVLTPSFLVRSIETMPYQVDVNTTFTYKNTVWIGASYRHEDAVIALMGFSKDIFSIGYSYDYSISDIQNYNNGSHEICLSVRFNQKNNLSNSHKTPWNKRNRLYTP